MCVRVGPGRLTRESATGPGSVRPGSAGQNIIPRPKLFKLMGWSVYDFVSYGPVKGSILMSYVGRFVDRPGPFDRSKLQQYKDVNKRMEISSFKILNFKAEK